jgi:hypothetical protein
VCRSPWAADSTLPCHFATLSLPRSVLPTYKCWGGEGDRLIHSVPKRGVERSSSRLTSPAGYAGRSVASRCRLVPTHESLPVKPVKPVGPSSRLGGLSGRYLAPAPIIYQASLQAGPVSECWMRIGPARIIDGEGRF